MDHPSIFPEDLCPGYSLTVDSLERIHEKTLSAFGSDPEHAETLNNLSWAPKALFDAALAEIKLSIEPLYDFDLAFNYWNWIYQFALYGTRYELAWDRMTKIHYPRIPDANISAFTHAQGLAFVKNREEIVETWMPVLPGLLDQLEKSGVRIICNHATWMSQGFLIVMLHRALAVYCARNPSEAARAKSLGLLDPMEFGTKANTLLGPWITTLGHKLSPEVSDLPAIGAIQSISNVVKVFPDTPSGRFECCRRRWKMEVRRTLRLLRELEDTPGTLIFETPSGKQDAQLGGNLVPGPMAKAAVRLSKVRPNQVILVGMDERDLFDGGIGISGFQGGIMRYGRMGLAVKTLIASRPKDSNADWPFKSWHDVGVQISDLVTKASANISL
ncbi:MAG: hypothetical protein ACPGRH_07470 [Alphaproteobacteria bacterium]